MKVIIELEFDDEQRRMLVQYWRSRSNEKGLPPLATRAMCRAFVHEALDNQWLDVGDQLEERK